MELDTLLIEKDATGLAALVGKGEVDPLQLVDAAIARCERLNPVVNAVAETMFEEARRMAGMVDRSRPFAGVPIAIKDLAIAVAGVPVHSGSRVAPWTDGEDSLIVRRYRQAGLIPLMTSTTPEHGLRLVTESSRFGITRNPWNREHTSGGSSGGAASLVAARIVPVAHASDGGGSIRVPAACTGLVGMKPSRGRVPADPVPPDPWFGLAVQHALTRSVRDSAALLDIAAAPHDAALYRIPAPDASFVEAATKRPERLSLGVFRRSPLDLPVSGETMAALDQAVALAREAGHEVQEIDIGPADHAFMLDFARIVACATAGRMIGEKERLGRDISGGLERATRIMARFGAITSGGELAAAHERLQLASMEIVRATLHLDAVLMPIIAHPPVGVGALDATGRDAMVEILLDRLRLTRLLRLERFLGELVDKSLWFTHWPAIQNVTGQPAVALPVHMTDEGLPLGIQAVGRPGGEATLFALAAQMEELSGWLERRPTGI